MFVIRNTELFNKDAIIAQTANENVKVKDHAAYILYIVVLYWTGIMNSSNRSGNLNKTVLYILLVTQIYITSGTSWRFAIRDAAI